MPIGNKLMEKIINFGATGSFFSGHAASAVATYTGYLLINYHPNIILALILPIITSRITLAHHYISDVIGGIIFGYVTTKLVYHTINKPPKNRLI
jgi:membrane-associated phospholipid phosphatase